MAAPGEKPYRVYRGGRTRGKVPRRQVEPQQPQRDVRRRPRRGWSPRRIAFWTVLAVIMVLIVWTVAGYFSVRSGVSDANARLQRVAPGIGSVLKPGGGLLMNNAANTLLIGTDHSENGQAGRSTDEHSDSLMVLHTDPKSHRLVFLSLPRDLRATIPGYGSATINAAMQLGGPKLAIRTVEDFTGLPVNHVVIVDFGSFVQLIDAVGGIDVNVPENILSNRFDCPYSTATRCRQWQGWRFHKGTTHMSGHTALIYSRIRENRLNPAESDVTRAERQQHVVQATLTKIGSFSSLIGAPFNASKYLRPISTDLSAWQLVQLGWVYKRAGRVLHCRLGGSASSVGGESVIVPSPENRAVIAMVTGQSAPQPPPPGSGPYGPGCVTGNRSIGR